jgi:hypothetical protein
MEMDEKGRGKDSQPRVTARQSRKNEEGHCQPMGP